MPRCNFLTPGWDIDDVEAVNENRIDQSKSLEIGFKSSDFERKYDAEYEKQKSLFPIHSLLAGTIGGPKSFQTKDNSYYDLKIRFQIVFCIVFAPIWIQEFSDLERY